MSFQGAAVMATERDFRLAAGGHHFRIGQVSGAFLFLSLTLYQV
jgi:hypothetical protein